MTDRVARPLAGVRVVESALLGPGALTALLADFGAEIVKVESPDGDYVRRMAWPIIDGVSLLHWHVNRGKRSVAIDLRTEAGVEVYLDLVRGADAIVEAMRPGALERRGLGYERLRAVNPRLVWCSISGFGSTGPYRDLPSHGVAYDAWSGVLTPAHDERGRPYIPNHASVGIHAGPLYGALAVVSGILHARETGEGMQFEIAQSDASASFDWVRSEGFRAYRQPEARVTGNPSDGYERRPPGMSGFEDAVRYQIYASADGHVLFMASEQEFWRRFCEGVGRRDLFDRYPGSTYADHALGEDALRAELIAIFATRTTAAWVDFANEHGTTIAPVNTPESLARDPQFLDRMPWLPADRMGTDLLPSPVKAVGATLPVPARAPALDEHTDAVLAELLGYSDERIRELRAAGAVGAR